MQDIIFYKQVDEKHLYSEVDLMLWSPKMDLIAVSTASGEVILHRLTWQKVWMLAQLNDSVVVTSMVWRLDGQVLCIGYSNGVVKLCSVEKAQCLYEHTQFSHPITSLSWCGDKHYTQECMPDELSCYFKIDLDDCFKDTSDIYLPELPSLTTRSAGDNRIHDTSLLKDQDGLNMLLVGSATGEVEIFAFGFIPVAKIILGRCSNILQMVFSTKLNYVSILSKESGGSNLNLTTYSCPLLNSQKDEIKCLVRKLGQLLNLKNYMVETLKQMTEVWEDILFEFESKLKKFAIEKFQKHNRSLRYELLRLLIYGVPSDDLKCFLQFDLTKQSLTRLGNSVQNSYSHIKKLINQNFHAVVQAIIFHLTKLLGMARWRDRFSKLGLNEKQVEAAIANAGSLTLKSNELLQVIDDSTRNFNAFYKWLYPIKLRLSGESVPHCMGEVSQTEVNFIVEFLNESFASNSNVRLEKVGQYLRDDDLIDPINNFNNPWLTFLGEASNQFHNATKDFVYPSHNNKSLIQVTKMLKGGISSIINDCSSSMKDFFKIQSSVDMINLVNLEVPETRSTFQRFFVSSSSDNNTVSNFAILPRFLAPSYTFYFVSCNMPKTYTHCISANVISVDTGKSMEIVDISFYNQSTLCLLINDADDNDHKGCSKVIHLDISYFSYTSDEPPSSSDIGGPHVRDMSRLRTYTVNTNRIKASVCRVVENSQSSQFSISGIRKVACILFSSRKRVRLFLTEPEDELDCVNPMVIDETTIPEEDAVVDDDDDDDDDDGTLQMRTITIDCPDDNDKENSCI